MTLSLPSCRRRFLAAALVVPRSPAVLWIALAITLSSLPAASAVNAAGAGGPQAAQQDDSARRTIYLGVFNLGPDADAVDAKLKTAVQQKLVVVDRACGLTDVQKERLELAGRGDGKQLLDRVEKMAAQLQLLKAEPEKVKELTLEAQRLARAVGPGLAETPVGSSLFIKALETTLTPDQLGKFRPLKVVLRAGGQILPRRLGEEDGLAIDLSDSRVTDDDIPIVIQIARMNTLVLANTGVTDAGVAHLKGLAATLQVLTLDQTRVTDAGLAHVEGLTRLQWLSFINTRVTDAGLSHLERLSELQSLMLQETGISDAGLAHLHGLTALQQLNLRKTQVTDAGLAHLQGLRNLKLVLLGANVTNAGITEMRQALPAAKILK
jgi:hypothetical protein